MPHIPSSFIVFLVTFIAVTGGIRLAKLLFPTWEERFARHFSKLTSTPGWFVCQIGGAIIWVPLHELFMQLGWTDLDAVVLAIFGSVIPYLVESILKFSSAETMVKLEQQASLIATQNGKITTLVGAIKEQTNQLDEQSEVIITLANKILDLLSEEEPEG